MSITVLLANIAYSVQWIFDVIQNLNFCFMIFKFMAHLFLQPPVTLESVRLRINITLCGKAEVNDLGI